MPCATVVSEGQATCVSPRGSSRVSVELTFADGCFLPFEFQYYDAPDVLVVRPTEGPRFGLVNISVFATNLYFLEMYPSFMTPSCSLGQQAGGRLLYSHRCIHMLNL